MAKRIVKSEFKPGELVKWYEQYADGNLIRDAGIGLLLDIKTWDLGFKDGPYHTYVVYRNKHQDTMTFEKNYIEKLTNDE